MTTFRPPNIELCKQLFSKIDENQSKFLETKEFVSTMQMLGVNLTKSEYQEIILITDQNEDKKLNFEEFTHFVYMCQNCIPGDKICLLFLAADTNFSGTIDLNEPIKIFKKLGVPASANRIKEVFLDRADILGKTMSYNAYSNLIQDILK